MTLLLRIVGTTLINVPISISISTLTTWQYGELSNQLQRHELDPEGYLMVTFDDNSTVITLRRLSQGQIPIYRDHQF